MRVFTTTYGMVCSCVAIFAYAETFEIAEDDQQINIITPELGAAIRKQGYVSGIAAGSLKDKKTGFRDAGFGLDIVDWIMEPGSDEAYRNELDPELIYRLSYLVQTNRTVDDKLTPSD